MAYISSELADRYASALFSRASSLSCTTALGEQLCDFCKALKSCPDWLELLIAPYQDLSEKKKMIDRSLNPWALPLLSDFVHFLLVKRRLGLLHEINQSFQKKRLEVGQEVIAELLVADLLSAKNREKIQRFVATLCPKKKVKLQVTLDKTLIGGYRLIIDGQTIDHSIKTKIAQLATKWSCYDSLYAT